jgi:hypothetical protein
VAEEDEEEDEERLVGRVDVSLRTRERRWAGRAEAEDGFEGGTTLEEDGRRRVDGRPGY